MNNKIIDIIKDKGPRTYRQLLEEVELGHFLGDELDKLFTQGELVEHNGLVFLPTQLYLEKATVVSVKSNFAFARIDDTDEDIRIDAQNLGNALLGDRVFVEINRGEYSVHNVFVRANKKVIGEIYYLANKPFLKVNKLGSSAVSFRLEDHQGFSDELVVAEITSYSEFFVHTKFIESLGSKNAPGNDILRILIEENIPNEFSLEVEEQLENIPTSILKSDLEGRRDFRDELIVTIDGELARDFDDAVSVQKIPTGYRLGIHIADVASYVKEKSPIDVEAYERGTSIYVTDRVVPMLPFPLSNGICSLSEGMDRLTISVIIDVDNQGQVMKSQIFPSVINSKGRLTYTYVQQVIDAKKATNDIEEMLLLLNEVSRKIRKQRNRRGSLDLNLGEVVIDVDEEGKAIGVHLKKAIEAEQLIEDLMVLTNEVVAETITNKQLPMLYRIHEQPEGQRIDNLNYLLKRLGHKPELNPKNVSPKDMQILVNKYKYEPDGPVIMEATLRSLAKAKYSPTNYGHFGLASACYTHFTSPIRRYPDLIVHRLIHKYLFNRNTDDLDLLKKKLIKDGDQTSDLERKALQIERRVTDIKSAEYMASHLGQKMVGMISGLTNMGMFIQLDNGISGLVRFDTLNDYYVVDDANIAATGKRNKKQYMLGDRVEVVIGSVNVDAGNIDLLMQSEPKPRQKGSNQKSSQNKKSGKRSYQNQPPSKRKNKR